MDKLRIQVYADAETKRRIELAAIKQDVSVTEYCMEAILQKLSDDDMLEAEQIEVPVNPGAKEDYIQGIRELQERILTRRNGQLIDVNKDLDELREERDEELLGLH